ncbi:MAG TPA: CYTH domain-containing protein [Hanamia sp.]|nr:CYTH domain-containing protein [Hanamia sp.]
MDFISNCKVSFAIFKNDMLCQYAYIWVLAIFENLNMGKEIERKYLVKHNEWQQVIKPEGQLYRQGYLLTDPNKTIRVRVTSTKGFLTIKGLSVGATRLEYEYEIPVNEATELLDNFSVSELSKTRFKITYANKTWEVDEFLGDNKGLIIAEIELTSEEESFAIPFWVEKEVTGDEKYYNSNLTILPYRNWGM